VPLFDFGEVRVREAEAIYMQAVNRLMASAVKVRSQAREAYQAYRSAYDLAEHYRRDVLRCARSSPMKCCCVYNAMQVDVFALLGAPAHRVEDRSDRRGSADADLRGHCRRLRRHGSGPRTPALAAASAAGHE
jgi:hypothetical protein